MAWRHRTYPAIYNAYQTWQLVDACLRLPRQRSSSRRHAFVLSATAPSPLLLRGHADMEQFARISHIVIFTGVFQASVEDRTVCP